MIIFPWSEPSGHGSKYPRFERGRRSISGNAPRYSVAGIHAMCFSRPVRDYCRSCEVLFLILNASCCCSLPRQGERHDGIDERYPNSELLLYKNLALSDAGMMKEALDHLEECKDKVRLCCLWGSRTDLNKNAEGVEREYGVLDGVWFSRQTSRYGI